MTSNDYLESIKRAICLEEISIFLLQVPAQ